MTVDVEEHFQVSAFEHVIGRNQWETLPSRVAGNTGRILDLLDEVGVTATFFVLGWIGERHPDVVRAIADRGHEVASHGYSHRLIYDQTPEEFRRELRLSRRILQDASGQEVDGHRAASFSIVSRNLWALDELAEAGFRYDSSLFPVLHDRYGISGAPRGIYRVRAPNGGVLWEVPPSTVRILGMVLPVAGGGYLRLYPLAITRWAISRLNRSDEMPAMIYVHPWEVDPGQPRIRAGWKSRFRHYVNLDTTAGKLRSLMHGFRFGTVRDVLSRAVSEEPLSLAP